VLEIRYTLQHNVPKLLFNSVWINLVSLASTYYSLDELFKGNWVIIMFYITGSVVGKYMGMQIKITEPNKRKKRFNLLEVI
jgi:hypothetical protein